MMPFFHQRSLVREAGAGVIGAVCSLNGSTDIFRQTSLPANKSTRGPGPQAEPWTDNEGRVRAVTDDPPRTSVRQGNS